MTHQKRTRRRAMAAASGFAALALALSACGGDDSTDDAVADATSAVASAATEATSAVGSAAAEATSAVADDHHRDDHDDGHTDADRAYLDEIRAGGVDVHDDADFIIRGHDACRDLEDGESADVVITKYYEVHSQAPENEGETVLTAAVNAFCPDYAPALNN
ncbi:MAG TPA: DUF732 domain-containing protein [Candidatus Dietzia intestinigallinarum]|nr:DUF732 domain-containing protein [Candidatus Dietzia intestinigallinarum]